MEMTPAPLEEIWKQLMVSLFRAHTCTVSPGDFSGRSMTKWGRKKCRGKAPFVADGVQQTRD